MSRSVHTRPLVSFHTDSPLNFDSTRDRIKYRIISFQTDKTIGEPSGKFTMTLKPAFQDHVDLLDLFDDPEGVWVNISAQINGQAFDVMLGNIDSIQEGIQISGDGKRQQTLSITGRDHGKVFETTEMYINIFEREDGITPAVAAARVTHENLQGAPHDFVTALIREWIGNFEIGDSQWRLPSSLGGQLFYDVLNLTTVSQATRGKLQDPNIFNPDQMGNKLWDTLTKYQNGVLNEMWTDLAPSPNTEGSRHKDPVTGDELAIRHARGLRPAFYLRERPFPVHVENRHRERWDALPTHVLEPADWMDADLSRGGAANKHNFWVLEGSGFQSASVNQWAQIADRLEAEYKGAPGGYPIYDVESIRKFGLRRFTQSTQFLPLLDVSVAEIAYTVSALWLNIIHDWYVVAPLEISGTLKTTRMMPWIRIGHRVKMKRRKGMPIVFYVEGVSNHFNIGSDGRVTAGTSLILTRGEPEDRDFLVEVYERIHHRSAGREDLEARSPGLEETEDETAADIREAPSESAAGAAAESDPDVGMSVVLLDEIEVTPTEEESSQDTDPEMNHDNLIIITDEFQIQPEPFPTPGPLAGFQEATPEERQRMVDALIEAEEITQEEAELLLSIPPAGGS